MNELMPIGFIPPIQPKEQKEAAVEIDKQLDAIVDLTATQRASVREIALAHAKNNQGRVPNISGIANLVRTSS
ncbi:MAG TPA: hypothetical protein VFE02_16860 [Candidatus Acidoferrales bacterium]|jgi:hypothetical protein|nr:hypothetical protein [Candidatus Acidoferrales bacterium]